MYDILLADPPWRDERRWGDGTNYGSRGAENHYPSMTTDEIASLPIADLCNENCALFLWSTFPTIKQGLRIIDEWGFKYKTIAWVWVKLTKKGDIWRGMGHYTRANPEPCLLGVKGRMPVAVKNEYSVIISPRGPHSVKPVEQYDKIDRLYPGTKRLELFARYAHEGWDIWGDNIEASSAPIDVLGEVADAEMRFHGKDYRRGYLSVGQVDR